MEGESPLESPGFTVKKKVDETWKKAVEKEKSASPAPAASTPAQEAAGAAPEPGKPDFLYFISGLGMQTLAALGELPDEAGIAAPADLGQAQYLIDVLEMLAAKTRGNLTPEEKASFEQLLYQLRVKFVQKSRAAV